VTEFRNLVSEGFPEMSLRSFRQLFHQHWANKNIAYHGNPIDGLQIMGLLETRSLDFERIICLGLNEGNLPPTNPMQTLIPMDLRRAFGLPTPREKQGLFAHHFYRLLHACKRLDACIYVADEVIGNNEASRYLLQLEMELARANPQVRWERSVYVLDEEPSTFERAIPKTPEILQRIDVLLAQSASASMWKKYLTCPLDFYYRYVMEFGEEESVEEEVEQSTFGTFIHATLEALYAPFAQLDVHGEAKSPAPPALKSVHVESMLKNYPVVLREQFMQHFHGDQDAFMKGKNRLSYEMALELTARFLRSEIDFLSRQTEDVYIESLERSFEQCIEVDVGGVKKTVRLRGIIDRVDRIGEKVRILDYKSGKVEREDVKFRKTDKEIEEIVESMAKRKHVLQLTQYAWLYQQAYGIYPESGIVSFISGNNQPFVLSAEGVELDSLVDDFPQYIARIMEEVYDLGIPFSHTEQHHAYCQYCG
jgi:RecB family exonuclease